MYSNIILIKIHKIHLSAFSIHIIVRFVVLIFFVLAFFFRLVFKRTQHHVSAAVFSRDCDVPVITCSTQEWALKQQLSSTRSVAACRAVGDVLAQRCCEAGITRIFYRELPWTFRSDAVSILTKKIARSSGLTLVSYQNID